MDETGVKALIAAELTKAIAPGGSLHDALSSVQKAISASATIETRVSAIEQIDKDLDKEFPFRAFERDCDSQAWSLGWKKLMIDRDHLANLADQMGDPSVAQTMALWAQNQSDPQITQLKDAVAFKNAPKTKWKDLCLENHGGSPDRFRGFMLDKSTDPDKVVAAIARKCLAFYSIIEKRFTSMQSQKKSSAAKIQGQRSEMMLLVYHTCKHMKLKARKAAARVELDTALLQRDFGADFLFGLGHALLSSDDTAHSSGHRSGEGVVRPRLGPDTDEPFRKNARTGPSSFKAGQSGPVAVKKEADTDAKSENMKTLEQQLLNEASLEAKGERTAGHTQKKIDELFASKDADMRAAIGGLMQISCRHCLLANRGIQRHNRLQCRAMHNKPATPCKVCADTGRPGQFHWREDCPRRH